MSIEGPVPRRETRKYFIGYAHGDRKLVGDLVRRLEQRLNLAREFDFVRWDDLDIQPGDRWHERIQSAIAACHFGLLLISFPFLNSPYVGEHELPRFVGRDANNADRGVIPVGLSPVPFDGSVDLKGLRHVQIFRDRDSKFFSERRSDGPRERFVDDLFQRILIVARRSD
jgi:hypothetical protein